MFEGLRRLFRGSAPQTLSVRGAFVSDTGRVRQRNEDSVCVRCDGPFGFAMVADGMGGARGGQTASRMAAQSIPRKFSAPQRFQAKALREALEIANKEIFAESERDASLEGMGTTCVALVIQDGVAWAAWVGDSRLYLIRERRLLQMTEDHSLVQHMIREGTISREQAVGHQNRNIITRALGSRETVEVSVWDRPFAVRPGDRFLLSSDGLHDVVPEQRLSELASTAGIETACVALAAEANRLGGPDNISVVLVEIL
jgi:PPM family protein phosphatase